MTPLYSRQKYSLYSSLNAAYPEAYAAWTDCYEVSQKEEKYLEPFALKLETLTCAQICHTSVVCPASEVEWDAPPSTCIVRCTSLFKVRRLLLVQLV